MQIENSFDVLAPPDKVFAFLLDVNRVAGCVPGAELAEVVDPTTFKGKVKIKVGPITVAYNGTATIPERDEAARTAKLQAEGRETTGPGSARATATMRVEEIEGGSRVVIATDYTVAGRVANFGRGVMEDVSRRLVGQMADCIKANLEQAEQAEPPGSEAGQGGSGGVISDAGAEPAPSPPSPPSAEGTRTVTAKPVNALSLFFAVIWDRIRALFGRRS